jgi:hypothetical protein
MTAKLPPLETSDEMLIDIAAPTTEAVSEPISEPDELSPVVLNFQKELSDLEDSDDFELVMFYSPTLRDIYNTNGKKTEELLLVMHAFKTHMPVDFWTNPLVPAAYIECVFHDFEIGVTKSLAIAASRYLNEAMKLFFD